MQSFYRRFVRDYLRYKDEIQCSGHEIVKLVRADARAHNLKMNNPGRNGSSTPDDTFYAMHVRRGDFQYKVSFDGIKFCERVMRSLTLTCKGDLAE